MGYDLISESGQELRFNYRGYPHIIDLALQYGWEPLGTTMPAWHDEKYGKRDDWPGIYCSNDYQVVSAEDANNMADALGRAQLDLRNKQITNPSDDWTGDEYILTHTIEFLRLGSFETW